MSRKRGPAPIYTETHVLAGWLMGRLDQENDPLSRRIREHALDLLEAVALALKGRRREEHLELADERLIALQILLRLAADVGRLNEGQLLHALERTDAVGRQLGGWLRSLEAS